MDIFQAMVQGLTIPVAYLNRQYEVIEANPPFTVLCEKASGAALGYVTDALPIDEPTRLKILRWLEDSINTPQSFQIEISGSIRKVMISPIRDAKEFTNGYVLAIYDLEDDLRASRVEVKIAETRLLAQTSSVEQADQAMRIFSHDAGNATAAILIDSEEAISGIKAKKIRLDRLTELLDRVHRNAHRIRHLLERTLSGGSEPDKGIMERPFSRVALEDLVGQLIDEIQAGCRSHKLHYRRPDDKIFANIEVQSFSVAFQNLVQNAIKYSPQADQVQIRVESGDSRVYIFIKDFGIGIPENEIDHIFERGYRASNVRSIKGRGIGLEHCAFVVNAHRGTITANSPPNEGTTFTIEIPTQQRKQTLRPRNRDTMQA